MLTPVPSPSLPLPSLPPSFPSNSEESGGESEKKDEGESSLPKYSDEVSQVPPKGLSPPDYRDALQDVVVTDGPAQVHIYIHIVLLPWLLMDQHRYIYIHIVLLPCGLPLHREKASKGRVYTKGV